jgi:hypothetical protein
MIKIIFGFFFAVDILQPPAAIAAVPHPSVFKKSRLCIFHSLLGPATFWIAV